MYDLLETINNPQILRELDFNQLPQLANQLRSYMLNSVAKSGGHLASNLGTIELAIAAHYVFNTPEDRLIWDVGHQSYAHKILTGRRKQMSGLRMHGGISGFPRRSESAYDAFGTAHSSTSISAALGMARAFQLQKKSALAVAIIGDGAMSGGMAFEAMNNAGICRATPLIVILNDNDMSISKAVGALNRYLARLMSGNFYATTRRGLSKILSVVPPILAWAKKFEEHAKGMIVPATLFEEFGFNYIGPIDGHDFQSLIPTLNNIKTLIKQNSGPQFLHVITRKGQGYKFAEENPILYHGPGKFNPAVGLTPSIAIEINSEIKNEFATTKPTITITKSTFTGIFGQWLCDKAKQDKRLIAITPAMCEGSGMVEFARKFPDRYYDVGIAEQHAVTFAAGMACEGLKPIVAIYSTFLQRAYDQLIHDVALQKLPVMFAIDRAGLVGADGATHHGAYDIAYLRCIPNLSIMAPADENECVALLNTAFMQNHPTAVRYPRGSSCKADLFNNKNNITNIFIPFAKAQLRRAGDGKIAIFVFGTLLYSALIAAETLNATVINMRFIKPLDEDLLLEIAEAHEALVTIEEGVIAGGAGSSCLETLMANDVMRPLLQLGLPDNFIDHGEQAELLSLCGLDSAGIIKSIEKRFACLLKSSVPYSKRKQA